MPDGGLPGYQPTAPAQGGFIPDAGDEGIAHKADLVFHRCFIPAHAAGRSFPGRNGSHGAE